MPDEATTTEVPQEPAQGAEAPAATPEAPEPASEPQAPEGEPQQPSEPDPSEAKLRKRAQAAETERDSLRTQLEAAHRQLIEGYARTRLVDPSDYFRHGGEVHMAEDGLSIDAAKVAERIETILTERPHLAASRAPAPNPAQGSSGGGVPGSKAEPRMGSIFNQG